MVGAIVLLSVVVYLVRPALREGFGDVDPGGLAIASVGLAVALVGLWIARRRYDPVEVAADLARKVVRVEQGAFKQLLGGDVNGVIDLSFTADMTGRVRGATATGRLDDVVSFYRGLTPGRVVMTGTPAPPGAGVVGDAGAGKTLTALKLVVDLAQARADGELVQVPVRLTATSWPGGTIEDWLARELEQAWEQERAKARLLLEAQLVLPVIDGVDELDPGDAPGPGSRAAALMAEVNRYQLGTAPAPVVLTCRRLQYEALEHGQVSARTVALVRLDRVSPAQARAFLEHRVADTAVGRAAWQPVLDALDPPVSAGLTAVRPEANALRRALDTPWRLTLAATVYHPATGRQPAELLTRAGNGTLHRQLLAHYIDAAVTAAPGPGAAAVPALDPAKTRRVLTVLACYLHANAVGRTEQGRALSSSDLVLHDLWPLAKPRDIRLQDMLLTVLLNCGALLAFGWALPEQPSRSWLILTGALLLVIALSRTGEIGWPVPRPLRMPRLSTVAGLRSLAEEPALALLGTPLLGAVGGAYFAAKGEMRSGPLAGAGYGGAVGLAYGLVFALILCLSINSHVPRTDPGSPLRGDLAGGLVAGALFGTTTGLVYRLVADPGAALTVGLASGLAFGLGGQAWTRYTIFRLNVRGRLPWRLASFLRRCQQAGLLRTAGQGWQFRHREIQEHLAVAPPP
ncbi:NACHT domain-containing protein [Streptomyces sp. NPDC052114]|uniref:NACHT domain-containing protein n=1 Tax=unclassified Streptomyces TaxID=2593676 RepID=UPI00341A6C19